MKRPAWFGPRRLLGGIGPRNWQGWAVAAAFVLVVSGVPQWIELTDGGRTWLTVGAIAVLLGIIYLTYAPDEGPDSGDA